MAIFIIIVGAIVATSVLVKVTNSKSKKADNIPKAAKEIVYFGGDITNYKNIALISYWIDGNVLKFWGNPAQRAQLAKLEKAERCVSINKADIINFSIQGEYSQTSSTSGGGGGGVSVGGAVVGGVLLGPVGAILGGHKKSKKVVSSTQTIDKRKTVLKFNEAGSEKTMLLDKKIYDNLCYWIPEKKIS